MTSKRLKRPTLERDRPIRTWGTLFRPPPTSTHEATGTPAGGPDPGTVGAAAMPPFGDPGGVGRTVSDAVETGYRVINEYMRVGQTAAQGFSPATWTNPTQPSSPADMQRLAQRVMQYGWDFAGLWFEMWTKMAGNSTGWPVPSAGPFAGPAPSPQAQETSPFSPSGPNGDEKAANPVRLTVSVVSERSTATALEFRPGPTATLVIHALRAEGHEAPPIKDVTIESPAGGSREDVVVKVVVDATQPPGVYNGVIVDTTSNLPRGTLSVRIYGDGER